MKKCILLVAALMLSLSSFAVSYRGMLDVSVGLITSGNQEVPTARGTFEVKPFVAAVATTSHGCQILPCLFAGVGFGMTYEYSDVYPVQSRSSDKTSMYTVPVFLDLRWDLDVRRKITPFVDLKIGYQFGGGETDLNMVNGYPDESMAPSSLWMETSNSFYFHPTVGVRFKGGKRSGFNLGISYLPSMKRAIYDESAFDREIGSFKSSALMLNLGFDF